MNSLWIALLLFSSSWLFTVPEFSSYRWPGAVLIASGVALTIFALRKSQVAKLDTKYAFFLIPLVVSAVFIPYPYNLGPILLAAGLAVACFGRRLSFAGVGTAFGGLILTVQSVLLPIHFALASRYHQADVMAPLANLLLRAVGIKTSLDGAIISAQATRQMYSISITWEKLATFLTLEIIVGGLLIMFFTSLKRKRTISLVFVVLAYMLARSVFLVLLFMDSGRLNIFWKPAATLLSLVPLAFILIKVYPLERVPHLRPLRLDRRAWLAGAAAFLCVAALIGVWGFYDPGVRKQGRVLIDEKHSNWEWTTEEYDTKWYGEKSGYNYYSLYDYLNHFYRVDRNFDPITADLLSGYDVLVVKTPTEAFAQEEVESIEAFVVGGGGLWLISDHTNVFGMSSYINPIAERFGLRYNYDSTYDLDTGALSEYRRPTVMPDPIVQHMPPFLFATSCTVQAPLSARGAIVGYKLKAIGADYSQKNFFPIVPESPDIDYGLFLQAAAVSHGNGRVVAFTDSTTFSNFWMFMPGKPELALGTMEWLNRENSSPAPFIFFLVAGVLLLGAAVYLIVKTDKQTTLVVVFCAGLLAAAVMPYVYEAANGASYALPQPHTGYTRVSFEQEHSDFAMATLLQGFMAEPQIRYDTFYVWNQRLGYVPSVSPSLEEATENADLLVLINPSKPFTEGETESIVKYVKNGGRVLLLDSAANGRSASNELLGIFDMSLDLTPIGRLSASYAADGEFFTSDQAGSVQGGEAVISTASGKSIYSFTRKGDGIVAVWSDSNLFCNASLGDVSAIPSDYQLQLSELEFWMLRGLINDRPGGE